MAQGVVLSDKSRDGIAALVWRNMGDLEEEMWERQEQWAEEQEAFEGMQATLEQAGLRILNRPNLLNQHFWTTVAALDNRKVPYGSASRISGTSYPYLKSMQSPTETTQTTTPTAEQIAAACAIYSVEENGVTTYHIFTDEDDFQASVATLAAADKVTEPDGELYEYALQWDITANSAYGNTEWLLFGHPSATRTYYSDVTPAANVRNYGQIEEMQPGQIYTLECWVRVLSGDGVWMKMGYGNSYTNQPYNDYTNHRCGVSDWIKVEGAGIGNWQRVSWTFEFNPSGDWYTETSTQETVDGVTHTKVTRTYNWYKKVGIAVGRKYTATVQVCGFRLVRGKLFICETYDDLEERVSQIENGDADIMANIGEADSLTATRAHIAGEVFTIGYKTYRATAAIAIGDTIAVTGQNANATIVTVAELIGEKADAQGTAQAQAGILANIAGSDTATATAAHAVGDVILVDGQLYKVTAAIAIGDTITDTGNGANVTPKTVAELIDENVTDTSALAPKASPAFTGTITLGSTSMSEAQLITLLSLTSASGVSF